MYAMICGVGGMLFVFSVFQLSLMEHIDSSPPFLSPFSGTHDFEREREREMGR